MLCKDLDYTNLAIYSAGILILGLVEYWLGKTQKTRAGSIIELLLICGLAVATIILRKKENQNGTVGN